MNPGSGIDRKPGDSGANSACQNHCWVSIGLELPMSLSGGRKKKWKMTYMTSALALLSWQTFSWKCWNLHGRKGEKAVEFPVCEKNQSKTCSSWEWLLRVSLEAQWLPTKLKDPWERHAHRRKGSIQAMAQKRAPKLPAWWENAFRLQTFDCGPPLGRYQRSSQPLCKTLAILAILQFGQRIWQCFSRLQQLSSWMASSPREILQPPPCLLYGSTSNSWRSMPSMNSSGKSKATWITMILRCSI